MPGVITVISAQAGPFHEPGKTAGHGPMANSGPNWMTCSACRFDGRQETGLRYFAYNKIEHRTLFLALKYLVSGKIS